MWEKGWRDQTWSSLDQPWDLIVIGGGITGAGILVESTRRGLKTLLVESRDFASGTSSRSSKLVHGGLRYLRNGQIRLIYESVREREKLVREGRGLVTPLGMLLACYHRDSIPDWVFGLGLVFYDLLAFKWGHRRYDANDLLELCPNLREENLKSGYRYFDAQTDDARLVLRLLQEARLNGGEAINYAKVTGLLQHTSGSVCGVILQDQSPEKAGQTIEINASMVINATGAWADELRQQVGGKSRLRKLRGSHLIFPAERLPLTRSLNMLHPIDGRPVFALPWEGVTLVGTTDIDQKGDLPVDPAISPEEVEYLLRWTDSAFPCQELKIEDVMATFSGVRPVVNTGKIDPSRESREHILWCEEGLLTVSGGKLTTFRLMARDALNIACARLPELNNKKPKSTKNHVLKDTDYDSFQDNRLSEAMKLKLFGRYGLDAPNLISGARPGELESIPGTLALWAEIRWAARNEAVTHLDDLLLRRVRVGLLLPNGASSQLERIRQIAQPELGWDDQRWNQEVQNYQNLWKQSYYIS